VLQDGGKDAAPVIAAVLDAYEALGVQVPEK